MDCPNATFLSSWRQALTHCPPQWTVTDGDLECLQDVPYVHNIRALQPTSCQAALQRWRTGGSHGDIAQSCRTSGTAYRANSQGCLSWPPRPQSLSRSRSYHPPRSGRDHLKTRLSHHSRWEPAHVGTNSLRQYLWCPCCSTHKEIPQARVPSAAIKCCRRNGWEAKYTYHHQIWCTRPLQPSCPCESIPLPKWWEIDIKWTWSASLDSLWRSLLEAKLLSN